MKDLVRIKSLSKGLVIQLNEEAPFENLLAEVVRKFKEGKSFFGKASVAISFAGRELTDPEQIQMIDAIQYNCDLTVVCVVDKDEETDKLFLRAMQHTERQTIGATSVEDTIQVFRGALSDGEKLDTPSSIIILGDVCSGCSISSEKNILVMGTLYGEAHAGVGNSKDACFVAAMEMAPEALSIGDFIYSIPKKSLWGKKKNNQPLVAKVLNDKIELQQFTNELLSSF